MYECGEPTIGSSFVQFDLRFYVVALLFIIFDVEVAFFFPWAAVFGKATQLSAEPPAAHASALGRDAPRRELGVPDAMAAKSMQGGGTAAVGSTVWPSRRSPISACFSACCWLVSAYVWKRGDLDWVRTVDARKSCSRSIVRRRRGRLEPSQSILSA